MKDLSIADSFADTCEAQRFNGNIQPELIAIFETID
jgi:hypothetical protein